jgi:AraC family transcriptional regulator
VRASEQDPAMTVALRRTSCAPGIWLTEVACTAGPRDPSFEEWHDNSCVAFVTGGGFGYRCSAGSAALGPGALLLGNAGTSYTCTHAADGGDRCLSFAYSAIVVEEIAVSAGVRPSFRRAALPASAAFAGLAAQVAAGADGSGASLEEVAVEAIGRALCTDSSDGPSQLCRREERRAVEAMRAIDATASESLSLLDMAQAAGVGRYHFLRAFRAATGTTPHQYLLAARLRRAARLLLTGRMPVTEVAFEAGFGDLSNFIRTFRRATGRSPRAFRAGAPVARARADARAR